MAPFGPVKAEALTLTFDKPEPTPCTTTCVSTVSPRAPDRLMEEVVPAASVFPTRTRLGETQTGKAAAVCCAPVPEREMVAGELVALLLTATLPVTLPVVPGAKVTFKVADCPGASVVPEDTPLALKPAPETETPEIETLEFPEFVSVIACELLEPVFTFPKLKLLVEAFSK